MHARQDFVHPILKGLPLYGSLILFSVVFHGVNLAFRGAFLGTSDWVERITQASAVATQAAAVASGMLLIYLGLLSVRAARSTLLGALAALLGAGPTAIILLAQKWPLNQQIGWYATFLAGSTLVVCSTQAVRNSDIRLILGLAGGALLSSTIRVRLGVTTQLLPLQEALGAIELLFRWSTLGLVLLRMARRYNHANWRVPLLLGCSLLLATTAIGSSLPDVAKLPMFVGRTIIQLAPVSSWDMLGPLGFATSALVLIWTLVLKPASISDMLAGLLCLGLFTAATPLSAAWLTVTAFAVVVISWSGKEESEA